jgi:hypothetical protein
MNSFKSKRFFIAIVLVIMQQFLAYFNTGSVESYIISGVTGVYLLSWVYSETKLKAGVIELEAKKQEGNNE